MIKIFLKECADRYGNNTAFEIKRKFRKVRFSFQDIYQYSTRLSRYLTANGLKQGNRVLILSSSSPEWNIAFFGSLMAGGDVVPLDPEESFEHVFHVIEKTNPGFAFIQGDRVKEIKKIVSRVILIEDLMKTIKNSPIIEQDFQVKKDIPAEILCAAGDPVELEGFSICDRSFYTALEALVDIYPARPGSEILNILPIGRGFGLLMNFFSLKSGAKSIFLPKISGAALQRTFQENKISIFPVESPMLRTFLDSLRTQVKEQKREKIWKMQLRLSSFFPCALRRILFHRFHRTFGSRLNFIVNNGSFPDLETEKLWKKMGFRILTVNGKFQPLPEAVSMEPGRKKIAGLKWEHERKEQRNWLYGPIPKFITKTVQKFIFFPFLDSFTSIQVENKKNLDKIEHPAVLIFNHAGNYDGCLVIKILPPHIRHRTVAALMDEHWNYIFRPLYWHTILNVFPFARRGRGVRSSLEALSRFIDKGWFVLYAPEGEIPEDTGSIKFKPGIGYIAVEMELPVVPFKIEGYEGVFPVGKKMPRKHGHVTIKVGEPLTFSKTVSYREATNQIRQAMESL